MTEDETRLLKLLNEASDLAAKVYGVGARAVVKSYCGRCVHPIHLSSLGWKHDSFSYHDAEPMK